jgi:PilZ domain
MPVQEKENRRHQRSACSGVVRISWEDSHGIVKYAQAKCLDVSDEGLKIETTQPIPVFSTLSLRADFISLSGSARVRHCAARECKYILGLNLSQPNAPKGSLKARTRPF